MRLAVVNAIVQTNIFQSALCLFPWVAHLLIELPLSKTVNAKSLPEGVPLLFECMWMWTCQLEPFEWSRMRRNVTDAHSSPPLTQLNNGTGAEAGSDSDFYKPKRKYNCFFRNKGDIWHNINCWLPQKSRHRETSSQKGERFCAWIIDCNVLPLEKPLFFFQCHNLELHLVSQILSCEMKVITENIKLGTLNWIFGGL